MDEIASTLTVTDELLTPTELAHLLGVSYQWVLDRKVELGGFRLGEKFIRFRRDEALDAAARLSRRELRP